MRHRLRPLLALLAAIPALSSANMLTEAHSRAFGPQKVVRVARPTLRWEVWPGPGSRVTQAVMSLNGKAVGATYDSRERTLAYTPQRPLAPGSYQVSARVVVDDRLPVERKWAFRVAEGALHRVPEPTDSQVSIVAAINGIRERLGLPSLALDPRLCAAALGHSEYLNRNRLTGHAQRPADPGFLGASPSERLDAFGFAESSWEGVDVGAENAYQSVQRLFDAPYHRLPFMQPGRTAAGAGFVDKHMTIEFGISDISGVVTSPAEGERDVPLSWVSFERPDPLRIHDVKGEVGYPIVFNYFTPKGEGIRVVGATLRTALGQKVPIYLNHASNDEQIESGAIIIPRRPLAPDTGYEVRVDARSRDGADLSRTWRFVTATARLLPAWPQRV